MISLNDVLLAMSNIPVDDPIAEIWGRGLQGGYKIIEYTGALPITITANGDALLDYRIYGVDGGVGVATENLFDKNAVTKKTLIRDTTGEINYYPYYDTTGMMDIENDFVITFVKSVSSYSQDIRVAFYDIQNDFISCSHKAKAISPLNITVPTGTKKVRVSYSNGEYDGSSYPNNLFIGMTVPTSYIPYGYKLPMTIGDGNTAQTVPVYIGENQLDAIGEYVDYVDFGIQKIVRKIGIHTVTGAENWNRYGIADTRYVTAYIHLSMLNHSNIRCNSLPVVVSGWNKNQDAVSIWVNGNIFLTLTNTTLGVSDEESIDVRFAAFKSYLASLYNSGNPVKIWYVSSSQTEQDPPVPLPEIPTIDGTTVIDYDGDPKPSQMYIKYKG